MESKIVIYAIDAGIGDCILIFDAETNRKILIDSGPAIGRGRKLVESTLIRLLGTDNTIDIAIVTHNDNDHIGGFKSLLNKGVIKVNKFLFNDISTVRKVFSDESSKISFKQDVELANCLEQSSIKRDLVVVDDKRENFLVCGNMKLTFISPSTSALIKLKDAGVRKLRKISTNNTSSGQTLASYMKDMADGKDHFVTDLSPTNRSSISFKLDVGRRAFLFLADINAEAVESFLSLNEVGCHFDLVKLSHHGSDKNTSNNMLQKLTLGDVLICSDGMNSHGHPSLNTIARVKHNFPSAKFYFSSDTEKLKQLTSEISGLSNYATQGVMEIEYPY